MDELFREPHDVYVTHPVRSRDAGTNVGSLNYESPPAERIGVKCMLQMRGGTRSVLAEGAAYPIDASMKTTDSRVRVDDLVEPQTPAEMLGLKFVVVAVMFKTDVDGAYRYSQCTLTRSASR